MWKLTFLIVICIIIFYLIIQSYNINSEHCQSLDHKRLVHFDLSKNQIRTIVDQPYDTLPTESNPPVCEYKDDCAMDRVEWLKLKLRPEDQPIQIPQETR